MWGFLKNLAIVILLAGIAHADVGLLLNESTREGLSRFTASGHSAVYLSRVCPDGPVRLRLCAPGEQGSIISNYSDFGEDKPYEWNIVPLSYYLYGVETPADRPLYASPELRAALQEHFREKFLGDLCPAGPCTDDPKNNWRDMVAANFVRSIYMFEVTTTLEQDEAFIAKFNALPNVDHYNGFTRNCADFARLVVNTYFPGAARPDHINDFWMTSPKAIAKSFTHYAVKRPDLQFRVIRFSQIPGSYHHSDDARKGTEVMFTQKKWFFPMLLRSDELIAFTAAYQLTGRFNPEHELRRRPTEEVTAQLVAENKARHDSDYDLLRRLGADINQERQAEFGDEEQWEKYASAFDEYRGDVAARSLDKLNAKELANAMDAHGNVVIDSDGAPWVEYREGNQVRRVGVSAANVNAPFSDGELAYAILLARSGAELSSSRKHRETLPEFQADWQLLQDARRDLASKTLARHNSTVLPASSSGSDSADDDLLPASMMFLP